MHLGIWEIQGNKNGKLIKVLMMKKLARQSHLRLTLKLCGPDEIPLMEFFKVLIPR